MSVLVPPPPEEAPGGQYALLLIVSRHCPMSKICHNFGVLVTNIDDIS